jgi:hypothetical protein
MTIFEAILGVVVYLLIFAVFLFLIWCEPPKEKK